MKKWYSSTSRRNHINVNPAVIPADNLTFLHKSMSATAKSTILNIKVLINIIVFLFPGHNSSLGMSDLLIIWFCTIHNGFRPLPWNFDSFYQINCIYHPLDEDKARTTGRKMFEEWKLIWGKGNACLRLQKRVSDYVIVMSAFFKDWSLVWDFIVIWRNDRNHTK